MGDDCPPRDRPRLLRATGGRRRRSGRHRRGAATPLLAELTGSGARLALACGVGEPAQVESAAAAMLERFGRSDIVVDNAAQTDDDLLRVRARLHQMVEAREAETVVRPPR